jgi:hypothetical protein
MKKVQLGHFYYSNLLNKLMIPIFKDEETGIIGAVSFSYKGKSKDDRITLTDPQTNTDVTIRPFIFKGDEFNKNFINLTKCAVKPAEICGDIVKFQLPITDSTVHVTQSAKENHKLTDKGFANSYISWEGYSIHTYAKFE